MLTCLAPFVISIRQGQGRDPENEKVSGSHTDKTQTEVRCGVN